MKPKRRIISFLLAICLVVGLMPTAAFAAGTDTGKAIQLVGSENAANIDGGQADSIYFGTYQQSSDGNKGYNVDPIKWRVLSNADGKLFLLSDQNLDVFEYHKEYEAVTWETSTMRSWLNGLANNKGNGENAIDYTNDNFLDTAFSAKEQAAIADTEVVNDDNPVYQTEGGNNTTDKVFLLSIAEAGDRSYFAYDNSRIATNTAYVAGGGEIGTNGMYSVGEADYWWLRSPGDGANFAAYVDFNGSVVSSGYFVVDTYFAVRPAFNLNLESVLFTSAAAGGKIPTANGGGNQGGEAADAIFEIGDYDGNEWKLTLLDRSRKFAISNATANSSDGTIAFSYSGAQTGTNEYISAVVKDNGAITHYGRILQLDGTENGESGTASLVLPTGVTLDNDTKLYVFNEQYNGGEKDNTKLTDYASNLIAVNVDTTNVDTTVPTLTASSVSRESDTNATVKFTSNEAGTYYYSVVDSGENEPDVDTTGTGTACDTTEQTISLTNLTAGAKDIYIVVKDAAGNVSDQLKIEIPAYVAPSYGISANPSALNFASKTEGYEAAPEAQTVTITNTGNQTITLNQPTATDFNIGTLSTTELASGGTATFTVQPKTGLTAGSHSETLTISGSNGTSANVGLSFAVTETAPVTYTVSFAANGGTGTMADVTDVSGEYTLPANGFTAPAGKQFKGWATSATGSVIADTSITVTEDTTLYAIWEDIPATEYAITVTDGKATVGAGTEISQAAEGTTVTLTANAAPADKVFDKWEVVSGSITLMDANSETTTFTMPASAVSVKATYKDASHTHTFDQEIIKDAALKTAADCTHDAVYYKSCSCGEISTDDANTFMATDSALDHDWPTEGNWSKDADKHWYECSCGAKAEEAAHTASDWITDTAATATTDGTKHKECTVCKRVLETGTIPATGGGEHTHNYSSDWKSDSINHWKECSCGHKDDVAAHSFKWVIDKEATATKKGSKHEECKFCGYQRPTVEIPATGSTTKPTNPTESNPNTGALDDVPQTGDNSSMILWIVLLIASGLGVTGTVVYSKRKKYAK